MAAHLTLQQRQLARKLRREGNTIREVAVEIGCSLRTVKRVTHGPGKRESQGIVWSPGTHRLSLADREEISLGLYGGDTMRAIATRVDDADRPGAVDGFARGRVERRAVALWGRPGAP